LEEELSIEVLMIEELFPAKNMGKRKIWPPYL
jgi:hypothetical protein